MAEHAIDPGLPPGLPPGGAAVTIGTFDGVHRGHWEVLEELRRHAARTRLRSVLVTFHPHPLRIVRPEAAPRLLTTPLEKKEILAESGIGYAVFLPFTPALSRYSPERFVEEILRERLGMTELVIGYDHGFGRGRSGDVETLRAIGEKRGFAVHVVPAVHLDGHPISSSRIRTLLDAGDVERAAHALGRPYSLRGPVVRGEGRGHSLGFPTANIHVPDADKLLPREGVYAVRAVLPSHAAGRRSAASALGVLHLGPRPTFRGSPPSIELHLFDFDGDLYGEDIRVDFCAWLRGIHHFRTVPELIEAIRDDCAAARELFSAGRGACQDAGGGLE